MTDEGKVQAVIRPADPADLPELMRMAKSVHYVSNGKRWALFEDNVHGWVAWLMESMDPQAPRLLLVAGAEAGEPLKGFLGASLTAPFCIPTALVSTEHIVWVDEEHRGEGIGRTLIEAYCSWAKQCGCSHAYIGYSRYFPGGKKLGKLYKSLGFELEERQYLRRL